MADFAKLEPADVVPVFLDICPNFRPIWIEHLRWWGDGERGEYNDIKEFARFVVDCFDRGNVDRFPEVFETAEGLLREGNAPVRDLIAIGLLEDIQIIASDRHFGYGVFVKWLGPLCRQAWGEIEQIWEGKESLMDVVREENKRNRDHA